MAYETQPGTIPHRVVEHLKTLQAEAEVSAPELAETLGVDTASIVPTLITPCKHGALTRRKREARHSARKVWWYSLGDGQPEQPSPELDADEPAKRPPGRPPKAKPPTEPVELLQPLRTRQPRVADATFDAWLSTAGVLRLQGVKVDDDGSVALTPQQTAQVKRLIAWSAVCA